MKHTGTTWASASKKPTHQPTHTDINLIFTKNYSNIAISLLAHNLKARILAKQGDKAGAIAAAKESTELALKAEGPSSSFARMNQDLISSLH